MYEILVAVSVVANIVLLVLFVRSVGRGVSKARYNIITLEDGEVLQGPLSLRRARKAQRKWDDQFVWDGGPCTTIELDRIG